MMLRPGLMLHVYGVEGELPATLASPRLAGTIDDGGWTYLVFVDDAADLLAEAGIEPGYEATLAAGETASLVIEPSLAFGTGAHPTTRRCLRLISALVRGGEVSDVLDLGCGTGVLSLAALRFGARSAVGCDISALAVGVARANAKRNGLDHAARFIHAAAEDLARPADLVLANLPPAALGELLGHPSLGRAPWIIASGMLAGDLARLRAGLPAHVQVVEAFVDGFWNTALIRG